MEDKLYSHSIVDARLFVRLDVDQAPVQNETFAADISNLGHLCEQLLLFETIIIPTTDFGIVPTLIHWLGASIFQEAIENKVLMFARRTGFLGYAGNGNGICTFVIKPSPKQSFLWWQDALFRESSVAVEQQLLVRCPELTPNQRSAFLNLVISNTIEITYPNEFFIEHIANEAYRDIIKDEHLSNFVRQSTSPHAKSEIHLPHLPQIGPSQLRVLGTQGIQDAVDLVLRVAEVNMEVYIAVQTGGANLFTVQGSENILKKKISGLGLKNNAIEQFVQLLDLNNLPDLSAGIVAKRVSVTDIWKVRNTSASSKFRVWLRNVDPKDARELERAYVDAVSRITPASHPLIKALRLALTTSVGLIEPISGLITSTADTFFADKWLSGYSPKIFLDEIEKLLPSRDRE